MTTTFFNLPDAPNTVDQLNMNMRVAKNQIMTLNSCNNEKKGSNDHFLTVLLEIDGLFLNDLQKAYCKTWVAYLFIRKCKQYEIKCYSYMDVKYLVEAFHANAFLSEKMWLPEDEVYFEPEISFGKQNHIDWLLGFLKEPPYDALQDGVVVSNKQDRHVWNIREVVLNIERIWQIKTIYKACEAEVNIITSYYNKNRELIPEALFIQEAERIMSVPASSAKRFKPFADPSLAITVPTTDFEVGILPIRKTTYPDIMYKGEVIDQKKYAAFYKLHADINNKIQAFKALKY